MCVSAGSPAPNHTIHALLWLVGHRLSPLLPTRSARFLTQLTVVAHVSWLTHTQELSDAVLALTAVQARLGAALVDLCKHLGRGEIGRGR